MAWAWFVGGFALLAVLALDVFVTVFDPDGHGGPVNRIQNRVAWGAARLVVRVLPTGRLQRFVTVAGPATIVCSLLTWAALLIVGFSLLFRPFAPDLVTSGVPAPSPLVEALYFSGVTAATLGLGDIAPTLTAVRLLTVVEALAGFALVTVSVSYVLSVYGRHAEHVALAEGLCGRFGSGLDAVLSDARRAPGTLDTWAEHVTAALLATAQAHRQYPTLCYVQPLSRDRALLAQVGWILDLLEALDDDPSRDELLRPLSRHQLRHALGRYLEEAGPNPPVKGEIVREGLPLHLLKRRHDQLERHFLHPRLGREGETVSP